jgi:hypothetical protein
MDQSKLARLATMGHAGRPRCLVCRTAGSIPATGANYSRGDAEEIASVMRSRVASRGGV